MFPLWRLKIREAKTALNEGRPEEASLILQQESVRDFLPAKRLSHEVAQHLVSRAEQHLQQGDSIASWSDLQHAARLGGCDSRVAELRQRQAGRTLQRVRNFLLRGETKMAADQIALLEQRRLGGNERRTWKLIVELIEHARASSRKGDFTAAIDLLGRAASSLPDPQDELADMFATRQAKLELQRGSLRHLTSKLHQALTSESWTDVLTTAEAMLELAPSHTAACQARQRAWDVVGMKTTRALPKRMDNRLVKSLRSTHAWTSSPNVDTKAMQREKSKRVIAWIDGVGGYLICLGNEVMLGQPSGSGGADVPILADLSRRHASIRREGEAYVITPIHKVSLDGIELKGPQVLQDNALLELGASVRLRFRKPHALSSTAILTLESHHKLDPAVDGIVLMSESCVLGSKPQSHIPCLGWEDDLVLFRRGEELQFRTSAHVEVDGQSFPETTKPETTKTEGGVISDNTRIAGESFSLSFEEV